MKNKVENIPINATYHVESNQKCKEWEDKRSNRYKEYRNKWIEYPLNFILEDAPIHLDIEPTSSCNLKCVMCPRTILIEEGNFQSNTMDIGSYKRIIDEAASIGVYSIKLNWRGEPLIHPNIVEMVRYAKEKDIEDVMFNTNAVLLNEDMSKELIEAGLDKIFFSFDSPYKNKYEEIRVGANFEDTLSNIKQFVDIRNSMGKDTPLVRVSMVLMEDNKGEYEVYKELFENIVDVVAYVEFNEPKRSKTKNITNESFACSQLWQRMFIDATGDVIVCCLDSEKEYIVGNVNNNTLKNIWKNDKYMNIRMQHQEGKYYLSEMCVNCPISNKKNSGTI